MRQGLPCLTPPHCPCAQGQRAESLQQAPTAHNVTVLTGSCNLGKLPDCLLNYRPPAQRQMAQVAAPAAVTGPLHSVRAQPAEPGRQLSPTLGTAVLEPVPVQLERARSCSAESDELPLDMLAARHRADFAGRWPRRQAAAAAPAALLGEDSLPGALQPKPHHELSAAPSPVGSPPSNLYLAQQMQPHVATCAGEVLAGQQAKQQPETRQLAAADPDTLSQQPQALQVEVSGQAAAAVKDMLWEPQEQLRELALEIDALAEPCGAALHHQQPAQEAEARQRPAVDALVHQELGSKVPLAAGAVEAAACQHFQASEQDTSMAPGSQQGPLATVDAFKSQEVPVADADVADLRQGPCPAAHTGQAERLAGQHPEGTPAARIADVGDQQQQQMAAGETKPAQQQTQERMEGLLHQADAQDLAPLQHQPSSPLALQAATEGPMPSLGIEDLSTGDQLMICPAGALGIAALTVVLSAGAHCFLLASAVRSEESSGQPDAALLRQGRCVQQGKACCCLTPQACAQSPGETPTCTTSGDARETEGHRAVPGWLLCTARPAEEAAKLPAAAAAADRGTVTPSALTEQEGSAPAAATASQPAAAAERKVAAGGVSAAAQPASAQQQDSLPAAVACAQPGGRAAAAAASEGLLQAEEAEAAEFTRAVQKLMSQVLRAVTEGSPVSHVALTETGESLAGEPPVQTVLKGREASPTASAAAGEPSHEGQPSAKEQPEQHSGASQTCCELPGSPQQQKLPTQLPPGTRVVDPAVIEAEGVSQPAVATTPAAETSGHGDLAAAPVSGVLKAEPQQKGAPQGEPEGCTWEAAQPELVPASASVTLAELPGAAAGLKAEVGAHQGRGNLSAACMVSDCRWEAGAATVSARPPGADGSGAATAEAESSAPQEPPAPVGVGAAPEMLKQHQMASLVANTLSLELPPPSEAVQAETGCSSGQDTCTPEPDADTCVLHGATSLCATCLELDHLQSAASTVSWLHVCACQACSYSACPPVKYSWNSQHDCCLQAPPTLLPESLPQQSTLILRVPHRVAAAPQLPQQAGSQRWYTACTCQMVAPAGCEMAPSGAATRLAGACLVPRGLLQLLLPPAAALAARPPRALSLLGRAAWQATSAGSLAALVLCRRVKQVRGLFKLCLATAEGTTAGRFHASTKVRNKLALGQRRCPNPDP